MITLEELVEYAQLHDGKVLPVYTLQKPKEVVDNITEQINEINKLGGYKKVCRIVIAETNNPEWDNHIIYLQSKDNGDKAIYIVPKKYKYTTSLIEGLSVYCQANDLQYSKI